MIPSKLQTHKREEGDMNELNFNDDDTRTFRDEYTREKLREMAEEMRAERVIDEEMGSDENE